MFHVPVMVTEVLEALQLKPGQTAVDGTAGSCGHAILMGRQVGKAGAVVGVDRDPEMLAIGARRIREDFGGEGPRLVLEVASYEALPEVLGRAGLLPVIGGILLDLGMNSLQLEDAARGFAFSKDGPLDGRFSAKEGGRSMGELVNTASEGELRGWLKDLADERLAVQIARRIVAARARSPITTTTELADLVRGAYPAASRHAGIHPATRTFQALRMVANDEANVIRRGLEACVACLAPGSRLVSLSFHSGEDRIVKQFFAEKTGPRPDPGNPFRATTMEGVEFELPQRKAVACSEAEAARNPRARSAKMRVIQRCTDGART